MQLVRAQSLRSFLQYAGVVVVLSALFLAMPAAAKTKTGIRCAGNSKRICEVFVVSPAGGKDRAMLKLYDQSGVLIGTVTPYGLYKGSVVVRRGDTDGDGTMEFVTIPGKAGTTVAVKVWSVDTAAKTATLEATITVGDGTLNQGARLMVTDLDADGTEEIVVSARTSGNDSISVYQYQQTSATYAQAYTMNASYAQACLQTGDVNGDGKNELVVSPRASAGSVEVYQWDGAALTLQKSFAPFGESFDQGLRVRVGNVVGNSKAEIVVTPRQGASPDVKVYGWDGTTYSLLTSFSAYGDRYDKLSVDSGIAIRLGNILGDSHLEVVTAPWKDGRLPLRVWQAGADGTFTMVARQFFFPKGVQGLNLVTRDVATDRVGSGHEEIIIAPRGRGGPTVLFLRYNPNVVGNLEVVKRIVVFHPSFKAEVQLDAEVD